MSSPSAAMRVWWGGVLCVTVVALGACNNDDAEPAQGARGAGGAAPAGGAAAPSAAVQTPWPELAGTVRYAVDPASSEIYWLLGKTGAMAAFAHVHTISAETYEGTVTVDGQNPQQSRFELVFPVQEFVVDDPELRARLGEEFEGTPSENDIAGTKTNMLSAGLLNGAMFENVRLTGRAPPPGSDMIPVAIEIVGRTFELELPGSITVDEQTVEVDGEFTLSHADLGLTPFSAAGGAIRVADDIRFFYRIRAQRVAGAGN